MKELAKIRQERESPKQLHQFVTPTSQKAGLCNHFSPSVCLFYVYLLINTITQKLIELTQVKITLGQIDLVKSLDIGYH